MRRDTAGPSSGSRNRCRPRRSRRRASNGRASRRRSADAVGAGGPCPARQGGHGAATCWRTRTGLSCREPSKRLPCRLTNVARGSVLAAGLEAADEAGRPLEPSARRERGGRSPSVRQFLESWGLSRPVAADGRPGMRPTAPHPAPGRPRSIPPVPSRQPASARATAASGGARSPPQPCRSRPAPGRVRAHRHTAQRSDYRLYPQTGTLVWGTCYNGRQCLIRHPAGSEAGAS